jgi:hypothetical protein
VGVLEVADGEIGAHALTTWMEGSDLIWQKRKHIHWLLKRGSYYMGRSGKGNKR